MATIEKPKFDTITPSVNAEGNLGNLFTGQGGQQMFVPKTNQNAGIISPESITPTQPIQLPSATGVPTPSFPTTTETPEIKPPSIDTQAKTFAEIAQPEPTPAETERSGLISGFTSLSEKLFGKSEAQAKAEAEQGIQVKTQAVTDIQSQIKQLENDANIAKIKAQQTGETTSFGNAQIAQIERDRTVKALQLNSFLYAAQGNLATAQMMADKAVSTQFAPVEAEIAYLEKFIELNKDDLSREDKKRAEALSIQLDERKRLLDEQKATRTGINNIAIEAAKNGADATLLNRISKATSQQEALQIMASDPNMFQWAAEQSRKQTVLDTQIKQAQLRKLNTVDTIPTNDAFSPITQAIIDNPSLFDDLTPTLKGSVIKELQKGDYDTTNLGTKGLSDTAIKEIAQTQKALDDLVGLGASLKENEQFLGPISGWQKLNPWSKSRQVQADVDRVRQTVGKALEGGVLRKEDEEKYKKILATLLDTPATAAYKIEALTTSIQRDVENYKALQQASGKSLDVKASLQKGASTTLQDYQALY